MKEYKKLAIGPHCDIVDQLNNDACDGWQPILVWTTTGQVGPPSVILEREKPGSVNVTSLDDAVSRLANDVAEEVGELREELSQLKQTRTNKKRR